MDEKELTYEEMLAKMVNAQLAGLANTVGARDRLLADAFTAMWPIAPKESWTFSQFHSIPIRNWPLAAKVMMAERFDKKDLLNSWR